jgi:uncharacterized membrane protein
MPLISHFHPLLVHFPIALVLAAAAAELAAIATPRPWWHAVAIANVRAGAVLGLVTAITGWLLASSPVIDATPALEWHRWLGLAGALSAGGAALMSSSSHVQSRRSVLTYRATLFGAALLVAIAGHLGGTLVWGADFLRP